MAVNPDFRDLFSALNAAGARYLVVGGYAVAFHAEPRYTKDLDVWVEASPENAAKVYAALREFGAPLADVSPLDFAQTGLVFQMGVAPNRIDIVTSIDGVGFPEAWDGRVRSAYGGVEMAVISREELLRNKRAMARPQDLLDVETIERHTRD